MLRIHRFLGGAGLLAVLLTTTGPLSAAAKKATAASAMSDVASVAQQIDRAIQTKLDAAQVPAAAPASDAEFLRRVYLDITGVIPPADKAAAFLDSKDPNKRAQLIDELLASPSYGRHLADIWQEMMLPKESNNRRLGGQPLVKWLEENFNANKPWNEMVYELLTATGAQDQNGAVTYFLANPTPDKINDSVCQLFLGVRLQCAQCHNHPFTNYKQDEYWAMAAFFMKVRPDNVNKVAKTGGSPGITEDSRGGKPRGLPESAKFVPAKFLQAEQPKLNDKEPYRPVLAAWMTTANNPFFAKAMVNRMWSQLFGKGIVNPVDDMHADNPPTNPELLKALADQFVASNFDLKHLVRCICNSQAYQRTSKPSSDVLTEKPLFERMAVKPLTPEQLYDALAQVMGGDTNERGGRGKVGGGRNNQGGPREQFVNFFMIDEGADSTAYNAGIPQALRLMNSPQMNRSTAVTKLVNGSGKSPAAVIEQLFLATLSRRPAADESQRLVAYVEKNGATNAYNDIFWTLLNCSEFALNH